MVQPLRLKGSETSGPGSDNPDIPAGVSVYGLQEMSSSEIGDGIIYRLLKEFAKVDTTTPKTGDLTLLDTVGDKSTTLTGDYVDTNRSKTVGTRGDTQTISGTSSTTLSVYQVLNSVTGTVVRPLYYDNGGLYEMTDQQILDAIIDPALDRMTNRGLGSYHMSSGSPVDPGTGNQLPGTWTSVFTLKDTYRGGNIANTSAQGFVNNTVQPPTASGLSYTIDAVNTNLSTTYTLWRKTEESSVPSTQYRPLKWANTAENGKHIIEMTNADILTLLIPFRNEIVNGSGKGRYRFQSAAPSTGTWARRGDRILDLLNVVGTGYYQWGYARFYTGAFTGYYNSAYTGTYTKVSTATRTQNYAGSKLGLTRSDRYFTSYFTSPIYKDFTRPESSVVNKNYVAITLVAFTAPAITADTLIENDDYLYVKRAN